MQISRTTRVWLAAAALAAGCGDDGNTSIDAPVHTNIDAPDIDGAPALATVHGTGTVHGITDAGEVTGPRDFTIGTYAAYSPVGSSFMRNVGAGNADGTFTVPVVDGAHDWQLEWKPSSQSPATVWVTSSTAPNFDSYQLGRVDAAFTNASTPLTLALTGLTAWGAQDSLQLFAPNAGAIVFSPEAYTASPPATGAVAFTGTLDYEQQLQALPDASKGDKTVVTQLTTRGTGATAYSAIGRIGTATDFSLASGVAGTLTLGLTAVAQDQTFAMHWKRSEFDALKASVGAGALSNSSTQIIAIDALPQAGAHGFYSSAPDLVVYYPQRAAADLDATFTYGQPFSTGGTPWEQFAIIYYQWNVPVALNGTAPTNEVTGFYGYAPLSTFAGGDITLPLSAVRNVKIAGKDATVAQTGVGTSATLTWDAPTTGTPTSYYVQLQALSSTASGTTTKVMATFRTSKTSLQFPSNYLAQGATYLVAITASATVGEDLEAHFLEGGMPSFQVTSITSTFQP